MFSSFRRISQWVGSLAGAGMLACAMMLGCGGGENGSPQPPPPTPTVSLSFGSGPLQVRQGDTATLPITILRGGGFTGAVRITADGLPAGVGFTVTPAGDVTGDSAVATFTVTASAAVGSVNASLRVAAVAGAPSSGSALNLQVQPLPTVSLNFGSDPVQVRLGQSAVLPMAIQRGGGFTGAVRISVSGLPPGVDVTMAPAGDLAGDTATATFSASTAAAVGTVSLLARVEGVSGSPSSGSTLVLQIQAPPSVSLAHGDSVQIRQGSNTTLPIAIQRGGGFSGAVRITAEGLPAGVDLAVAPAGDLAGDSATATFSASSTAVVGEVDAVLRVASVASGDPGSTSTVHLQIQAPPSVALGFGNQVQLNQGQTATLPVTIQRGGGFTGPVRISAEGLPAGVDLAIAPAGDLAGDSATLTFSATPTAPAGTTNVLLRAVAVAGSPSSGATLTVQILPPPAGFQVALGTSALELPRPLPGETQPRVSAPIPITLTRVGGYGGSPAWAVEGLPAGVTATFNPAPTGEPSSLTLSVAPGTSAGSASATVRATDGPLSATAGFDLTLSSGNDYKLKTDVLVLQDSDVTVLGVSAGSVTLQGTVPSAVPGKVLIHNAADGKRFARRVDAVSSQGGNTVLATSEATLEDIFETAFISKSEVIPATALSGLQPANGAITIGAPVPGLKTAQGTQQQLVLPVGIANWKLKDGSGQTLAVVNGSLTLTLGVETRLQKDGLHVREFRVAPYVAITGDLDLKGNYAADFNQEYPITLPLHFPTPLGVGPLGVNGDITLILAVDGHVDAQGQLHVHGSVNGKAGIQYVDGDWSGVSDFSTGLAITSAEVRAAAKFGVSLVRPQLGLDVLGIGELHASSDVIRGEVDIAYQTSPTPGFLISRYGDFKFSLGGSLKVGPFSLWNSQISTDLGRFVSGLPTLLPDLRPADTRIAYVTPDLRELHVMSGDGTNNTLVYASTTAVFAPSLDPTGRALVFGRINGSGVGDLCTINADGSGFVNRTNNTYSINHPAWGPGGSIAFDAADGSGVKQIFTLDLGSGAVSQLTHGPTTSRNPAWSPDGSRLLYEYTGFSGAVALASTTPAIPNSFDIFYADDTKNFHDPCFSANGRQVVFRDDSYFYVVNDLGTLAYRIGMGSILFKHPVFSPDGNQLAVEGDPVGPPFIATMAADGTSAVSRANGMNPSWRKVQ